MFESEIVIGCLKRKHEQFVCIFGKTQKQEGLKEERKLPERWRKRM